MNCIKPRLAAVQPPDWLAQPRFQSRVAFARDDSSGARKSPRQHERLLIVEDDYLICAQMEAALSEAGYEVVGVASTADEAVELATQHRPALAILDIRLTGKRDGIDTALELFRAHGIRCVFATAHSTTDVRTRAEPAAPLAWLPKPYTMTALVHAVEAALRQLSKS